MSQCDPRRKIHACWLGKAIGGTLGAPHEGKAGPLNLEFYDPVPTGVLPNDDLDLQVVWLHHLRTEQFTEVTPEMLSDAWQRHVLFPFDEYAVVRRNRALGLIGVAQGATDNYFSECMGAAIRSEVWACVAPGDPQRAAGFAWADAVIDHAGEGVWAAVFHAALQAAAFDESDPHTLIEIGLATIPKDSRLYRALRDTLSWWPQSRNWRTVRDQIVARYATGNFTDVVCNLCFELVGWFDGAGDFGRSICTAVNCGLDTDCTGATLGALMGIIDPDCIPEKWCAPIGEAVVLSPGIVNVTTPRDLNELTDWTIEVSALLAACHPPIGTPGVRVPERAGDTPHAIDTLVSHEASAALLDAERPPAQTSPVPHRLGGGWSQWRCGDFEGEALVMKTSFTVDPKIQAELVVFYAPKATAWVNDCRVLTVTGEQIDADPSIAPSAHRAGPAVTVLELEGPGPHELVVALEKPSGDPPVDLVLGLANHADHLWLTGAFQGLPVGA